MPKESKKSPAQLDIGSDEWNAAKAREAKQEKQRSEREAAEEERKERQRQLDEAEEKRKKLKEIVPPEKRIGDEEEEPEPPIM